MLTFQKYKILRTTIIDTNSRTNFFILGVFFLVWSVNGFFIGGNLLKIGLLFLGFGLILCTSFTLPKRKKFVYFSLITFSFFVLYWFIAIIRTQKTVTTSIFLFDIICFFLLLSGYLVASNLTFFKNVSPKIILFISFLAILGGMMYVRYQSQLLLNSIGGATRSATEDDGESGINVIGIAYTNAILFFILYYFIVYYNLKKWITGVVLLSMFCVIFVILATQSRGALIFIVLILLMTNFKRMMSFGNFLKFFKIILVTIFLFVLAINFFPEMQQKIDGTISRFQTLLEFSDDVEADQSSYERTLIIQDFFDNIEDIVLLGKERYSPYPHNQFLEIIMRWGIFFGVPLLIFSISSFVKSAKLLFRGSVSNPFVNLILLVLTFCFLQSLSSMSLEMNRMLWFGFGFVAALPNKVNNLIQP
ncbi:O-antigen ligase [Flavobacterium sp. LC2016-12]|uniref:O-antigen ligase family protein n=1 Tax=Flavobacterium sp. LC2016-12 TaxID=2783794 RepID=UPI00188D0D8A|nr:O-antigen ligase family protein [Flavobacterium sp. LC2016-12]MBF4465676.1 O-antigen ligase family protein [Flavobacterium sp. LC2016-12]